MDDWERIDRLIHARFAEERPVFFDACISILRRVPDLAIVNYNMTPSIELIITVYQIKMARDLIAAKQYIAPENGNRFLSMLCTEALRYGSNNELNELVQRYWQHEEDKIGSGIFLFYHDLAVEITDDTMPAKACLLLASATSGRFVASARLAAAIAFGDRETVKLLMEP